MGTKARDIRRDVRRIAMAPQQQAATERQASIAAQGEQRADDYDPPAATEEERLTKNRFEAHFAFVVNPPMVKRSRLDHFGMGTTSGRKGDA